MGRIIENCLLMEMPPKSARELRARLRPNRKLEKLKFGYLGRWENFRLRIANDERIITKLGLTHEALAQAIENLFLSDGNSINGNPIIRREYIHSLVCPWGDFCAASFLDDIPRVTEIIVCNKDTCPSEAIDHMRLNGGTNIGDYPMLVRRDWAMIFSDLHPHLIRDHHFLEGRRTPYRMEPERGVRYLGIER